MGDDISRPVVFVSQYTAYCWVCPSCFASYENLDQDQISNPVFCINCVRSYTAIKYSESKIKRAGVIEKIKEIFR